MKKHPNQEQTAAIQSTTPEESACVRRAIESVLRLARDCAADGGAQANQQAIDIARGVCLIAAERDAVQPLREFFQNLQISEDLRRIAMGPVTD